MVPEAHCLVKIPRLSEEERVSLEDPHGERVPPRDVAYRQCGMALRGAHRAPGGQPTQLSDTALANLRDWYRADYELLDVCDSLRE